MSESLAAHVHAAVIGDDAVLLDVQHDAYFCIPGGRRLLGLRAGGRTLAPVDAGSLGLLREAGLLGKSPEVVTAEPPAAAWQPLQHAPEPFRPKDGRRLLAALGDYMVHYRPRSFAEILQFVSEGRRQRRASDEEVFRIARLFRRAAIWLPVEGRCLARSFVLLRFLQRSGADATWVFGVQTWPFAAHCWLQLGSVALDEAPERLALYEPILAV